MSQINTNLTAEDNLNFKFSKSGSNYGFKDANGNFVSFKTTHTETKSIGANGTTDMGADHKYRYVNVNVAKNVANLGAYTSSFGYTGNVGDIYIVHNINDTWLSTSGLTQLAYSNVGNAPMKIYKATSAYVSISWPATFYVYRVY